MAIDNFLYFFYCLLYIILKRMIMKRREFIIGISSLALALPFAARAGSRFPTMSNNSTFTKIIEKAVAKQWSDLPLSTVIGNVASELLGKSYKGGTLDIYSKEKCIINLDELDCVTFFENSLALARLIKQEKYSYNALIEQITLLRYRKGIINDYTSRLHYTADWIYDNVRKGTIADISKQIGGKTIKFNVSFMSKHPQYYKQLKNNPAFVKSIKSFETAINKRIYYYIPKLQVSKIESKLQTGDIIAIVNTNKGLDYSHTGLIYRKAGKAHFMHASSIKKKVIIDKTISQYLAHSKKSNKGISVLRPLEPENAE